MEDDERRTKVTLPFIMAMKLQYLKVPGYQDIAGWQRINDKGESRLVRSAKKLRRITRYSLLSLNGTVLSSLTHELSTQSLTLWDTFSFNYWWDPGQKAQGLILEISFYRDNGWHSFGWDLNLAGSLRRVGCKIVPGSR